MSTQDEATTLRDSPIRPDQPRMTRRQRVTLTLLLGSTFLLAADLSLLNVSIPLLGDDLGFAVRDLHWIATSFALTAAGLTLFFGRIADFFGRRLLFVAGMALLLITSLVGGLAETPGVLIAARVGQGIATAMSTPAALSLLTTSFPEGPLRARALGANGAMVSAGFAAGAVFGGLLTDLLSWRWAFYVNVPVCALIIGLSWRFLTESRVAERTRIDLPGALTVSLGLIALVYGASQAGSLGWASPVVLGLVGLSVVLLAAFWQIELRSKAPLASVWIMRRPTVSLGNLAGLATIAMQSGLIFLTTLYLQEVLKYSPFSTGLVFAVLGAGAFLGGVAAPRIIGRLGSRRSLVSGLALQMIGPLGLLLASMVDIGVVAMLAILAVGAFGHVTVVVSYMVTVTSGLPDDEQGLAAGLAIMTQQVALAVGIPVLSAVAASRILVLQTTDASVEAVLSGLRLALAVDAGVLLLTMIVIAALLGRRATTPTVDKASVLSS
jgi:MFS family permease